ncbi:MFS transporter [Salipiger sp. 1_MG-2023]|uniref:MFS transporter n=1 Tax=Salipiger sp. 1_MG-2023 TaxID=3062665 RepID=UPI0026E207BD|nr:MFS transporter [Salipiger sp. 1_MG-2023]MDO6584989.1 MFS transporter [Salipiger sp. 1_MG-2023]
MNQNPIANRTFRTLFAAQICSILGVGLLTVALSLAAWRIGGAEAGGKVLGLLLALKMVAYVGLAPFAETLLARVPRKTAMAGLDFGRMLLLLPMVFVTATWQIAALAFFFFVLASGFTPLFQSVIPDVLPDEAQYTRALAWSRIAYTAESVLSPVIAAVVLKMVAPQALFVCAALSFACSVLFLMLTRFPERGTIARKGPFIRRALRGMVIYAKTPRLRGLILLSLGLSFSMAWVLVNTVVYAGERLGDADEFYPVLMAGYGFGAALGAVLVPRLLRHVTERRAIAAGVLGFAWLGAVFALLPALPMAGLLLVWGGFGLTSSLALTPGGLVITRSAAREDRAAVFAAQFSLSHAGWLIAYPLAGSLAAQAGLEYALLVLAGLSVLTSVIALCIWPAHDPISRAHAHPDLPADHPHLSGGSKRHEHAYHIDDLHPSWAKAHV